MCMKGTLDKVRECRKLRVQPVFKQSRALKITNKSQRIVHFCVITQLSIAYILTAHFDLKEGLYQLATL